MHEMDLIPAAYKARRAQRQRQRRSALALGLLLLAVVGARLWIERGLAQERAWKAQWQPLQDKARAQRTELKNLQTLIAQASPPDSPTEGAGAPTDLLPSLLAALPASGLRLSSATLEAPPGAPPRLNLQGQVADETILGQAVTRLQAHPQVAQVQLLGVQPAGATAAGGQRFEMLLRVASLAASATAAGERP